MSRQYLTCVSHNSTQNRSQNKSVNSVRKKNVIDSTVLDQTSESCIVQDESVNLPMPVSKAGNVRNTIGRVGMSSRVSSKISFVVPKSSFVGKQHHHTEESTNGIQKSVFCEALHTNEFETTDPRLFKKS